MFNKWKKKKCKTKYMIQTLVKMFDLFDEIIKEKKTVYKTACCSLDTNKVKKKTVWHCASLQLRKNSIKEEWK